MSTENYICPNCGGRGCPVCQNIGKIALSEQEVSELQKLMTRQSPVQNQPSPDYSDFYSLGRHKEDRLRGQLAGILTLVFLAVVSVSGFLSWFFTKTFKPFFQFWTILITIAIIKPIASLKFFQEERVEDFIGVIEDEGIDTKLSPLYPLM